MRLLSRLYSEHNAHNTGGTLAAFRDCKEQTGCAWLDFMARFIRAVTNDHSPGQFVVPALLPFVEGDPDNT